MKNSSGNDNYVEDKGAEEMGEACNAHWRDGKWTQNFG
jgi:hypothetical protein